MSKFIRVAIAAFIAISASISASISAKAQIASAAHYLDSIKAEMVKEWPQNRTVNIVFHGHSVPAGYAHTPTVNTLVAYPHQTLVSLKRMYPYAVVNCIVTAIGGENSEQGAVRFDSQVRTLRPDVVFIDYALNDRGIGVERAEKAWRSMIESALAHGVPVILCTPTPDLAADICSADDPLTLQAEMIRSLAAEYHIGLADFYKAFCAIKASGDDLSTYMAQGNHPNAQGHQVALSQIEPWFE